MKNFLAVKFLGNLKKLDELAELLESFLLPFKDYLVIQLLLLLKGHSRAFYEQA